MTACVEDEETGRVLRSMEAMIPSMDEAFSRALAMCAHASQDDDETPRVRRIPLPLPLDLPSSPREADEGAGGFGRATLELPDIDPTQAVSAPPTFALLAQDSA
jgi:predicted pyridoxine 5'-phosphate oxidase superfamily flavin-nucleotide-binding protein